MARRHRESKDGGPAFPIPTAKYGPDRDAVALHYNLTEERKGMTLRDYFAGQALIAFLTNEHNRQRSLEDARQNGRMLFDELASVSYQMADAMIAARAADDPTGEE